MNIKTKLIGEIIMSDIKSRKIEKKQKQLVGFKMLTRLILIEDKMNWRYSKTYSYDKAWTYTHSGHKWKYTHTGP